MTFELDRQYIVEVTINGIIPKEEFKRERFFDKDHDNLDFLTDEEKIVIINGVLDKIRAEIEQKQYDFMSDGDYNEGIRFGLMLAYQIIDKYKEESEETE